ncbi:MAG: isoprenylcysteine carboxylmethyltransferase family protein [Elioraea sp.]|nr:isoprenylcysteine carboxylmethyltransferase family protein [Elioraea sp.]
MTADPTAAMGDMRDGDETGTAKDDSPPPVAAHPPLLFPGMVCLALALDGLVPLTEGAWSVWLRFGLGSAVVVLAVLLAGWAAWEFHRVGTPIPTFRPARRFVASGPYAFTRNPMYLGLVLLLVGLGLLLASAWTLLLVPVFVVLLDRLVIAREEPYLAARFGAPYSEYLSRVRRWL